MRNYIIATAMLSVVSTTALADDFDNNTASATFLSGSTSVRVDVDEDGLQEIEPLSVITSYDMGIFQSDVVGGFAYDFDTDEISVIGQYNVSTVVGITEMYGSAEVEYRTIQTDFSDGDFYVNPSVGVNAVFNETFSAFAEVGYSWNATDDWAEQGGYTEIGMPINTGYGFAITPSLIRGFDDSLEETNFNLDVSYTF